MAGRRPGARLLRRKQLREARFEVGAAGQPARRGDARHTRRLRPAGAQVKAQRRRHAAAQRTSAAPARRSADSMAAHRHAGGERRGRVSRPRGASPRSRVLTSTRAPGAALRGRSRAMDYELGGVGMTVDVSPRRMSLTLTSSPRGKSAHAHADHAGGGASADAHLTGSPNTVLYHAFEGVAAGASPRTASDDGTEASPVDAAAGLQRHLTRAQALVRPS